jgi:hypothetical protein
MVREKNERRSDVFAPFQIDGDIHPSNNDNNIKMMKRNDNRMKRMEGMNPKKMYTLNFDFPMPSRKLNE